MPTKIHTMNASISRRGLEEIELILEMLDNAPAEPADNRRSHRRSIYRIVGAITLIGAGGHSKVRIVTRNISTRGFAFVSGRPLTHNELFVLCLPHTRAGRKAVLCITRFCRYTRGKAPTKSAQEFLEAMHLCDDDIHIPAKWTQQASRHHPGSPNSSSHDDPATAHR